MAKKRRVNSFSKVLRTELTSPIAKSTSLGLLDTAFFASAPRCNHFSCHGKRKKILVTKLAAKVVNLVTFFFGSHVSRGTTLVYQLV